MPVHPYIPNSSPAAKARMLAELGIKDIDELFKDIPESLRFRGDLELPAPFPSESALRRHMDELLAKNTHCGEFLNFMGGGCYQHYVPSVCDEINGRSEFVTAYSGLPYEDHGRWQAIWEYASMMGELLNMDVVNVPTTDGCQAAATAIQMASRVTGRDRVLVAGNTHPDKISHIQCYCRAGLSIELVPFQNRSGQVDEEALAQSLSTEIGAIYFDNPNYFGVIESGRSIADLAHAHGALCITGVDPVSLGVLTPPADYGADIVCGDLQALGMHMQYGGGHGGFVATRDDETFVREFPSRLYGIAPTRKEGEYGFGDVAFERTSLARRENGKEFVGTGAAIWGITAGVYLALMGPAGMRELGEAILYRSRYAARKLSTVPGVRAPLHDSPFFKEFVVQFDCERSVREINQALLDFGIFGGIALDQRFPHMVDCALFCFTELHTKQDIDRMVEALREIVT